MKKSTPLWCEDCRFVCCETGLGKPMLTHDRNGFKNTTNVYSIHLELRMALPCQISTGKWKYVKPCLDFPGIPDQRTAYVKRQARPRCRAQMDVRTWIKCHPRPAYKHLLVSCLVCLYEGAMYSYSSQIAPPHTPQSTPHGHRFNIRQATIFNARRH